MYGLSDGRSHFRIRLLIAAIAVAFIAMISLSISDNADSEVGDSFISGGLEYTVTSETEVSVTDYLYLVEDLTIPSSVQYDSIDYSVTSIGERTFEGCRSLKTLVIGDSVTTIGKNAFYMCTSLESVTLSDSVTTINDYAFYFCTSLSSLDMGNGASTIGEQAFCQCRSLTSITIGPNVSTIGIYAFAECPYVETIYYNSNVMGTCDQAFEGIGMSGPGITLIFGSNVTSIVNDVVDWAYLPTKIIAVSIPSSVLSIGSYAFQKCIYLTSVTIPNSVISIGNSVFEGCTSLTSVTLSNSITQIPYQMFAYCTSLESFTVGSNILSIQYGAFQRCTSLKNVTLGSNLSTIDQNAFTGCTSLTSVSIPSSVSSISGNAFDGCTSLQEILVADENSNYRSENGVLFTKSMGSLVRYPMGKSGSVYMIPSGVQHINQNSFKECSNIVSLTIPQTLTYVSHDAFSGCTSLAQFVMLSPSTSFSVVDGVLFNGSQTELIIYPAAKSGSTYDIPSSVKTIHSYAFSGNNTLSSITIPDTVLTIHNGAFSKCTSLTSVTIGDGITSIGQSMFTDDVSLETVTFGSNIDTIDSYAFQRCTSLRSVYLPDTVTTIKIGAFYYCPSLTLVRLGTGCMTIESSAFMNCHHLGEICNDSTLTLEVGSSDHGSIARYAVNIYSTRSGNPILNEQIISGKTTAVYYSDVNGTHLYAVLNAGETLTLPDRIGGQMYDISSYAFRTADDLRSITILDGVTSIGDYAFVSCDNLTEVTIDGVTSIGLGAFMSCRNVQTVTIGSGVKTIGPYAFDRCQSLTSLTIGSDVTEIGDCAFMSCNALTSIIIPESVKTIGDYAFLYCMAAETLIIGSGVTSIGDCAFMACIALTSITIPESVTSIGDYAFEECINLSEVNFNASNCADLGDLPNHYSAFYLAGALSSGLTVNFGANVSNIPANLFYKCNSLTSVTIPSGVTTLGDYAFCDCKYLETAIIDDAYVQIGSHSFCRCISLESITIPDTVTTIGYMSFLDCTSLESVTIGKGVSSIGICAFGGCTSLKYIILPENVKSIGSQAFEVCTFYDTDGKTKITNYSDLPGYGYSGVSSSALIRFAILNVFFDENGGSETVESISAVTGEQFVLPAYSGTLAGHTFAGWSYDSTTYPAGASVTKTADDMTFTAAWDPNSYYAIFMNGDQVFEKKLYVYGTEILAPSQVPAKASTVQYGYTFDEWGGFTEGMLMSGEVTFPAVYDQKLRQYTVSFLNDGKTYNVYSADYDSVIILPEGKPVRESTADVEYKFISWSGYVSGMKVSGEISFDASYETTVKKVNTAGNTVYVVNKNEDSVKVSSDAINQIRSAGADGKSTEILLPNGKISLDSGSAAGLPAGEQTISLNEADRSKIPEGLIKKIGDRPVYSIGIGDVHEFNGKLTISVAYTLRGGEDPSKIVIWYLKSDGTYDQLSGSYDDGYVTFTTSHLSDYAIMVDNSVPSSSGTNIGLIIACIVGGIAVGAAVTFVVMRTKH